MSELPSCGGGTKSVKFFRKLTISVAMITGLIARVSCPSIRKTVSGLACSGGFGVPLGCLVALAAAASPAAAGAHRLLQLTASPFPTAEGAAIATVILRDDVLRTHHVKR